MSFRFNPTTPLRTTPGVVTPTVNLVGDAGGNVSPLGPLEGLLGTWVGTGFNQIWRPFFDPKASSNDRFLELNITSETLVFTEIPGTIPNRGFLQADIALFGVSYVQQVNDTNVLDPQGKPSGIHFEPGIWLNVPATTNPSEPSTVARLGSIPHGTTIVAQGTGRRAGVGPEIAPASITPFVIGDPTKTIPFPDQTTLTTPTPFRSPDSQLVGVTQAMVDNPNSVLVAANAGKDFTGTTVLQIDTVATTAPTTGGGTTNISFLDGDPTPKKANARASRISATFWISSFKDAQGAAKVQLQYTQTVLLDFNGLSWPHVSVATLLLT